MDSSRPDRSPSLMQALDDMMYASWRGLALAAAIELDIFGHIADGKHRADQIAAAASASEDAIRRLLDALCGMGYLKKTAARYRLQRIAAEHLVRGKPLYMGDAAAIGKMMLGPWSRLHETVQTGRQLNAGISMAEREAFFSRLVPAIFPASFVAASAAVKKMPVRRLNMIRRILDIGAGAAAWSIPFAKALRQARVTVVDYPAVTRVTREYAEKFGVANRYDYKEGDFNQVDFGSGFDLALLGHIVHGAGAALGRNLLRKTCEALRKGGMLLIGEFVPNNDRNGPALPLLFGLNMLLATPSGDVFTMAEYRAWLKEAGFSKAATLPVPHVSPLILATR